MTELEQAREIIRGLLAERGLPQWLADIATEREELVRVIHLSREANESGNRGCCDSEDGPHARDCAASRLLRALDPDETQRQVDDAHSEVLWGMEATRLRAERLARETALDKDAREAMERTAKLMEERMFGWVDEGSAAALGHRPGKSDVVRRLMDGGSGVIRTTWDSEPL